jgi:hypothetical protein
VPTEAKFLGDDGDCRILVLSLLFVIGVLLQFMVWRNRSCNSVSALGMCSYCTIIIDGIGSRKLLKCG